MVISEDLAGQRLDAALTHILGHYSRGQVQKAIREGDCLLDGQVCVSPARKVRPGQVAEVEISVGTAPLTPSEVPLETLWRDGELAALFKPAGLTVHPCPSCREETLVHRLLGAFPQLAEQGGERPGIVHRLDRDTSGVMVIGLTDQSRRCLARSFARREVKKKYLALVSGEPVPSGQCCEAIGRHPTIKTRMAVVPESRGGRHAETTWRKLWQGRRCALLEVEIGTGRTHQIRVHMAHLGWPILGDGVYAPKAVAAVAFRQMLHAWQIELPHPAGGDRLHFCAEPPADFMDCALREGQVMQALVVTGNEGCGKSSFCHDLAQEGIPTVSADAIVSELYSGPGEAAAWIANHAGAGVITASGAVDKGELFKVLQRNPLLRPELEKVVHALVAQAIERFWQEHETDSCACAEIPLYFESSLPAIFQMRPFVVGISCPAGTRVGRIAASRGWSDEKIAAMESWQMPEDKKMKRCDLVIGNDGSREDLRRRAQELARRVTVGRRQELEDKLRRLCACPTGL